MYVTRYISELLLITQPWYYSGIHEQEPEVFKQKLWALGFNTQDFEIEANNCHHRVNGTNKTYNGLMFTGFERLDQAWSRTGMMTMEAVIASTSDKDYRKELVEMATVPKYVED